jgi:hypothetical protein
VTNPAWNVKEHLKISALSVIRPITDRSQLMARALVNLDIGKSEIHSVQIVIILARHVPAPTPKEIRLTALIVLQIL